MDGARGSVPYFDTSGMMTIRRTVGRIAGTLTLVVCVLLTTPALALAQTPAPETDTGPDVWGNMPGAVLLLIPIVIGLALYLSYRVGGSHADEQPTGREGAVSRALALREPTDA